VDAVVEALFATCGSGGGSGTTVDPRDHDAGASVGQGNSSGTGGVVLPVNGRLC